MNILNNNTFLDFNLHNSDSNKKHLYLYFETQAIKHESRKERIPLNISIVLDKSGSMAGAPIEHVKEATKFIIQNLNKEDTLSIVTYSSTVNNLIPAKKVQDKVYLKKQVDQITAAGMTNLCGGMLAGYAEVNKNKSDKTVNRVLLLSDGLANVGITENKKLYDIALDQFRSGGIGLSTFGVGTSFNEELMQELSERGGSNYYFIEQADNIPNIFAQELNGLLSIVAQNARWNLQFPGSHLKFEKSYGFNPSSIGANEVSFDFNDVFSEERKAVLIAFSIQKPITSDLVFNSILSYFDAVNDLKNKSIEKECLLKISSDIELVNASAIEETQLQIALFTANEDLEKLTRLVDDNAYNKAKLAAETLINKIQQAIVHFPTSEALKQLLEDVKNYKENINNALEGLITHADKALFQKATKMATYHRKRKKS